MVREGVILIPLARLITPVDPSIARAKNDFAAHLETHRGSASQMAARQRALITNGAPLFRPLPQLQLGRRGTIASLRAASQSDQCRLGEARRDAWAQKHSILPRQVLRV